jgi:phosphoesterase
LLIAAFVDEKALFMKKNIFKLTTLCSFLLAGFIYRENNSISKTYIDYGSDKVPYNFEGFKILQISDLHNKIFGKNQNKLIKKIMQETPDIIVITGDIYYSYTHKIKNSLIFLKQISRLYPVYFVTGNHEQRDKNWQKHSKIIKSFGIKIIDNKMEKIQKKNDFIQIYGLRDPSFYEKKTRYIIFEQKLKHIKKYIDEDKLAILLSHRPEKFEIYVENEVDLVFSGHAHGGQIRLFGQGLLTPGEGFFPKYTGGMYIKNNTSMILSRGLGRTICTVRLFNRPDIVVTTLHTKNE